MEVNKCSFDKNEYYQLLVFCFMFVAEKCKYVCRLDY